MVRAEPSARKPGSSESLCPDCAGLGHVNGESCWSCEGQGRVVRVRRPARTVYRAFSLAGEVDVGAQLVPFVEQLCRDWPRLLEDLVVWRQEGDGGRVVALIRPGVRGEPVVEWV